MNQLKEGENEAEGRYEILEKHLNDTTETTVIRISHDNYEMLRQRAFFERTTIRQLADDFIKEGLRSTY